MKVIFQSTLPLKVTLLLLLLALYECITARKPKKTHVKLQPLFLQKGFHHIKKDTIRFFKSQGFQKYMVCICFLQQNPSYKLFKNLFLWEGRQFLYHTHFYWPIAEGTLHALV